MVSLSTRKDKLKQHAAKHGAAGGTFQCRTCIKTFARAEHLRDHDIARHSRQFPFRYVQCSRIRDVPEYSLLVASAARRAFFITINCMHITGSITRRRTVRNRSPHPLKQVSSWFADRQENCSSVSLFRSTRCIRSLQRVVPGAASV